MALPKIQYPVYEIYLKSLDRKVKFRPFLVKEEKLLLMAKESNDIKEITDTIKQIVSNCCCEELDVDKLPLFDIEMFFIYLRTKSLGDSAKLSLNCQNVINKETGEECGHTQEYALDLTKVDFTVPEGHTNVIKVSDDIGIRMKYPTTSVVMDPELDGYTALQKTIINNIECIFDKDSVYENSSEQELMEFLDELDTDKIGELERFFQTQPRVTLKETIQCKKCGYTHEIFAEDLFSFFI